MIEVISIGTELLTGQTINTNAGFIAKTLLQEGYHVRRITMVPDQSNDLKEGIKEAMNRASFIIVTGGLGPTRDDITRQVLSEIFESQLTHDETVKADLKRRFGEDLKTIEDQSIVLEKGEVLHNPIGTAPGFILKKGGTTLFAFPGVPSQMEEMVKTFMVPYFLKEVPRKHFQKTLYLCLISEECVDPYLRELESQHPEVEIGICPSSSGTLSLYLHTKASSSKEAMIKFKPPLLALCSKFKGHLFSETDGKIESALHKALIEQKKTLAFSESCTGGRMASRITQMDGASQYFLGSLVTYSNNLKREVLQVSSQTLETHGAVSRKTVVEMALGTLALTGADYVVAVSGIAGPTGGSREKPVGTIWGAIGKKGKELYATKFFAKGKEKRELVIEYSVTYLLSHLYRLVKWGTPPFESL